MARQRLSGVLHSYEDGSPEIEILMIAKILSYKALFLVMGTFRLTSYRHV